MKKLFVAGAATLSVLGLAVGGGSTASNNMTAAAVGVQGYGQVVATGATVTEVLSTPVSTDASKLNTVVFKTSTDIRGKATKLTLKLGNDVVGSVVNCTTGEETVSPWTASCTVTAQPLFSSYDTTGLTVI